MKTKYIFVTGGVVSSLGKGLSAAAIGLLLKAHGYKVHMLKFDPYLNVDASLLNPLQHGEIFVTNDGAETDLDLGHYERLIDVDLTKHSSVTAGSIYQTVFNKERNNEYNGKTIQVIPHITDEIQSRLIRLANETSADFVIAEIGGTVGDYESLAFIEAIRQFKRLVGRENILYLHATLLPFLKAAKEIKTKPTQHSVNTLRSLGISPDMLILRSESKLGKSLRQKVAFFCDIRDDFVIEAPDQKNIFSVIPILHQQKVDQKILGYFGLKEGKRFSIEPWNNLIRDIANITSEVTIGILGPYVSLHDAYLSVVEATKHAGFRNKTNIKFLWLDSSKLNSDQLQLELQKIDGLILPGGFTSKFPQVEIDAIRLCRENDIPLLGICLGFELMIIEALRNIAGVKDANSAEFAVNDTCDNVVFKLKNNQEVIGSKDVLFTDDGILTKIYEAPSTTERFRYHYFFTKSYETKLLKKDIVVEARSNNDDKSILALSYPKNLFYIGVQYHPEFKSRPLKPHPLFVEYIKKCVYFHTKKGS